MTDLIAGCLALRALGVGLQLQHDWRRHGLTDFLYLALLLDVAGNAGLAALAWHLELRGVAALIAAVALVPLAMIVLKLRAHGRARRWWQ